MQTVCDDLSQTSNLLLNCSMLLGHVGTHPAVFLLPAVIGIFAYIYLFTNPWNFLSLANKNICLPYLFS